MEKRTIKLGILGLGTVGSGVAKILLETSKNINQKMKKKLELAKILDKDLTREREIEVPAEIMTDKPEEVLENPEIDIVIELIGGVNPAKDFMIRALKAKKHVVTANKEVMAKYGSDLLDLAEENGVDLYFEASVGGGIPIIRSLKESLTANKVEEIMGIVNGTTNYILTKMTQEGADFADALAEAQDLGYAEADPTADVDGYDAAYKLSILSAIAFGSRIDINDIYLEGISKVTQKDITYAKELNYVIKLLAIGKEVDGKIEARVHPTMIPNNHPLAAVNDSFNAVFVKGHAVGELMYYGRGAGSMPTGSAVVADVIDIARNIINDANGRIACSCYEEKELKSINEVVSKYYLRLQVIDRPGVLAAVSGILGNNGVSIESMIQKSKTENGVPLILVAHQVNEGNIQTALNEIDNLAEVKEISSLIRVEGEECY
ncbi:homoserine dehydrogenase [Selenihalanaerobacter shriftii]|uniref:Homoserine dehydrogenase n=1 Tax=Selenihalanaerobacter shriftii TaxID=142842 RepID=A0A1T4LGV4_9FIRM|nr:homoserine dehydrogenase [Selenihalanaerobacter shriftii]SJZ54019.1 homoserine dehydrogenase [Selenihalanaerobacter shriftii]